MHNYTPYYLTVFILLILIIAEIFGRGKHIGFWWSLILMLFGGVPGWVAIMVSPSVKEIHTQRNTIRKYLGMVVIILLGLPGIIASLSQGIGTTFLIYRAGFSVGLCVYGFYLYKLGLGEIHNNRPKSYFKYSPSSLNMLNFNSPISVEDRMYHVVVEKHLQKSEVFNYDELRKSNILNGDTLVWYNGLSEWVRADEVLELRKLILYSPPPIPVDDDLETPKPDTTLNFSSIINWFKEMQDGDATIFYLLLSTILLFFLGYFCR